jgi:hypothetical protein
MINRATVILIMRVFLLWLVVGIERAGGLPIWFVFGSLVLLQLYEWRVRTLLLLILSLSLSLSYLLPLSVGFGILWVATVALDVLKPRLKSQTLSVTLVTVVVMIVLSLVKQTTWTGWMLVFHLVSLGVLVALYRVYVGYQVLAPHRLYISRRLQNEAKL